MSIINVQGVYPIAEVASNTGLLIHYHWITARCCSYPLNYLAYQYLIFRTHIVVSVEGASFLVQFYVCLYEAVYRSFKFAMSV